MLYGLYTATQGMRYEALRMDVISNNLANAMTPGYKQDRIGVNSSFATYLQGGTPDVPSARLVDVLPGSSYQPPAMIQTHYATDFSQGDLQHTENPFDVALDGPGFLTVQYPDGSLRYTRDGHFQLDRNGQLVTMMGWPVFGQNGPIQLGQGDIKIDLQGQVELNGSVVDTLRVESFPQGTQLTKDGHNLFVAAGGVLGNTIPANTEVRQGYLETSNVDVMREMVRMIETFRNYEGYQKVIQSFDTTISQVNEVGRA